VEEPREESERVRTASVIALSEMAPEHPTTILARCKATDSDPSSVVRRLAAEGLGKAGTATQEIVWTLLRGLQDPDMRLVCASARALGQLGAGVIDVHVETDPIEELKGSLQSAEPAIRDAAGVALADIGEDLARENRLDGDRWNEEILPAVQGAEDFPSKAKVLDRIDGLPDPADIIDRIKEAIQKILRAYSRQLTLLAIVGSYYVGLRCALWVCPLRLLTWHSALQRLSARCEIPVVKVNIPFDRLLIPRHIGYHARGLDAWIAQHVDTARENFRRKTTVASRSVFVDLPLKVSGTPISSVDTAEQLRSICAKHRWYVLIRGEGGIGKTALACRMGLKAMDDACESRLCKHLMVPVLIEPNLGFDVCRDVETLKRTARGEIEALVESPEEVPEELFERLLRTRRILVILDGLSEMVPNGQKVEEGKARPAGPGFPFAALVVTSRTDVEHWGGAAAVLEPMRIDSEHLLDFVNAYLKSGDPDVSDDVVIRAYTQLKEMVDCREGLTPLLARMFAETWPVAGATEHGQSAIPRNVPDLVLKYLNFLNRQRKEEDPENPSIHRVARVVAWECVRARYRPDRARKQDVVTALTRGTADERAPDPQRVLDYLERCLGLIQTVDPEETQLQFLLDPLAEYLAAIHCVDTYQRTRDWDRLLDKAESAEGGAEAIRTFLIALWQCSCAANNPLPGGRCERLQRLLGPST